MHAFKIKNVLFFLIVCSLSACVSTPNVQLFDKKLSDFQEESTKGLDPMWWKTLNNPTLNELENEALSQNFSLQAAFLRLQEAYGVDTANAFQLLPSGELAVNRGASKNWKYATNTGFRPASDEIYSTSQTVSVSWELPLFGKLDALNKQSRAQVDFAYWQVQALKVSIASEVAATFIETESQLNTKCLLDKAIDITEDNLKHAEVLKEVGVTSLDSVLKVKDQLNEYRGQHLDVMSAIKAAQYKLDVLTGHSQQPSILAYLSNQSCENRPLINIPHYYLNISADQIRGRPDIRQAESKVWQAAAATGIANASLYPQFSLKGTLFNSVGALDNSGISIGQSANGTVGLGLQIPLLNWFALRQDAVNKETEMSAVIMDYRNAVIQAWQEVRQALDEYTTSVAKSELAGNAVVNATDFKVRNEIAFRHSLLTASDLNASKLVEIEAYRKSILANKVAIQAWLKLIKCKFN